jgi:hypothetical protein
MEDFSFSAEISLIASISDKYELIILLLLLKSDDDER